MELVMLITKAFDGAEVPVCPGLEGVGAVQLLLLLLLHVLVLLLSVLCSSFDDLLLRSVALSKVGERGCVQGSRKGAIPVSVPDIHAVSSLQDQPHPHIPFACYFVRSAGLQLVATVLHWGS